MIYQRKLTASITIKRNSTMGFTANTDQKHAHRRCDARQDCRTALFETPPLKTQTKNNVPRPSQQYSISALSTKLSTFNDKALIVIDQLHTLELLLRNAQQTSRPLLSPAPTTHQDAKPGTQDFTLSTLHPATPDPNWHNVHTRFATSTANHPNSTIEPAAPHDRSSWLPPAMDTICATPTNDQSIHLIPTNAIVLNVARRTTAIRTPIPSLNSTDPSSHSRTAHDIDDILPSTNHHMNTPSQATIKIVPNRPTFTQWCQQHAVLTKKIQRMLAHRKLVEHHLFFHEPHSRHADDPRATTNPTHAELEKKLIPLMTYPPYPNERSYLPLPDLVLHNALLPTQLELTSTLRRRHVRFRTTTMVEAMVQVVPVPPPITTSTHHLRTFEPIFMTNTPKKPDRLYIQTVPVPPTTTQASATDKNLLRPP